MTQPSGDPGNPTTGPSGITAQLFTQEQVNHFNAEAKRGAIAAYFKELGFDTVPNQDDLKGAFSKAGEFDKLQDGQKTDVERLTSQLGEVQKSAAEIPALRQEILRSQIAADAGLKSRYWKYVEGDTPEEITASVKAVLEDVGRPAEGDGSPPPEPQGRPPAPNPQQGHGGGQPPKKTLQAGRDAYNEKHKKE
jgi:hypothetical protein